MTAKRYRLSSFRGSPRLKEDLLGDIVRFEDYELANKIIELMADKIRTLEATPRSSYSPKRKRTEVIDHYTAKASIDQPGQKVAVESTESKAETEKFIVDQAVETCKWKLNPIDISDYKFCPFCSAGEKLRR